MKLQFDVVVDKAEELSKKFLVLSNIKRIKLLILLKKLDGPISSADVHREAKKEKIYTNRETTYRALEDLTRANIISKFYDDKKKKLLYCIKNEDYS